MKIAVIGMGYVGLPLAVVFADAGVEVVGDRVRPGPLRAHQRRRVLHRRRRLRGARAAGREGPDHGDPDYAATSDCDADIICLPTPLNVNREPDLSLVESATRELAGYLQKGQLVVLESTTYPGTTRDVLAPILEEGSGLKAGVDFYLAFSPERVDPGRTDFTTKTTPKVVGGLTPACTDKVARGLRHGDRHPGPGRRRPRSPR